MAISIDRVYKTVQNIMNIEQRGQLPPADFNSFASLAQLDLFSKLFQDKAHFMASQKGAYSDIPMQIQEKIDVFVIRGDAETKLPTVARFPLPIDLYMLETIYYQPPGGNRVVVEQIDHKVSNYILNSPLLAPSLTFPKYERYNSSARGIGEVEVYPNSGTNQINSVVFEYIKRPQDPIWGYTIVVGNSMYSSGRSVNFDLHPSMEDDLVDKILFYSAISIKQDDVAQTASGEISNDNQIDKT